MNHELQLSHGFTAALQASTQPMRKALRNEEQRLDTARRLIPNELLHGHWLWLVGNEHTWVMPSNQIQYRAGLEPSSKFTRSTSLSAISQACCQR